MKKVLFALLTVFLLVGTSHALTTLDFEGIPDDYYYYGGNQNLGDYYDGVSFGTHATVLDRDIYGYNSYGYPPRSGDAVLFTDAFWSGEIRVDFDNNTNHVELWYSSFFDLWLEAYDEHGNLLTYDWGDGIRRGNAFLEVNTADTDIAYVLIHDHGYFYTIDDFGWEEGQGGGNPIPEPATVLLMATGLLGIGGIARFARKRS
ncbi:MAG: PEP-CTERM sorting domain-containing protein [candidate division Zixibacteria bacterium]|nr:PEP-CTERM sorting domain-containing protein [candidate division Zixibacteria bacterium]